MLTGGSARANVDLACRAEQAGFHSVFSTEFFNQHGYVTLGAIAARTSRVRLGTAIANAFTRTPVLHATAAMDLDELSGGRMVLGLGSGTRRMNEDWYAVPFDRPTARMRELVDLIRRLIAAQSGVGFHYEGRFWNIHIPMYVRPGAARDRIPIWVAAVNPPMVRVCGAVADGLVGHPIAARRWHREVTLPVLRAAEQKAGRPPGSCRLVPYVLTSIQEDRALAVRDAKCQIGFYFTVKVYRTVLEHLGYPGVYDACRRALAGFDVEAMAAAIPDELVEEIAVACTPDEAPERLQKWADLTDEPLLYAPTVGVPPERVRANLDAILRTFARS